MEGIVELSEVIVTNTDVKFAKVVPHHIPVKFTCLASVSLAVSLQMTAHYEFNQVVDSNSAVVEDVIYLLEQFNQSLEPEIWIFI